MELMKYSVYKSDEPFVSSNKYSEINVIDTDYFFVSDVWPTEANELEICYKKKCLIVFLFNIFVSCWGNVLCCVQLWLL
jgi:hypothetical protein